MTERPIDTVETMIVVISRLIKNGEVVVVGTLSPIPAAAVYLAQLRHAPDLVSRIHGDPEARATDGSHESFGLFQRGMVDLFFLSCIQMDQYGNFNLSVIGDYNKPKVRFPGGAGSNMISMMAKRTIFFTTTHTSRLFVPQVDFVNGRAHDDSIPWRRGSMSHMVTPICLMKYDSDKVKIILDKTFPGVDVDEVVTNTGFDLGIDGRKIEDIDPVTDEELNCLRGPVREKLRKTYPLFCSTVWG